MLDLRELQSRFFYSIARPTSADNDEWQGFDSALLRLVRSHGALSAEARLDIYAQMYCARLLDALQEDFPRVAAVVGEERFRAVGRHYLRRHPSTQPSLRYLGRAFAEFLSTQSLTHSFPFLPDLARLEWHRLEVFDAVDTALLRVTDLQAIPAEAWATLRLRLIPAVHLLTCKWPVHKLWVNEERPLNDLSPTKTTLRIWRQDFLVYQSNMDLIEQTALTQMQGGQPFAAICAALEPLLPNEHVATTVGSLLLRWIEDGILAREYAS
ncbi:MAG: DUF2063 domain-containing protein [Candidatus Binatia bacterium]